MTKQKATDAKPKAVDTPAPSAPAVTAPAAPKGTEGGHTEGMAKHGQSVVKNDSTPQAGGLSTTSNMGMGANVHESQPANVPQNFSRMPALSEKSFEETARDTRDSLAKEEKVQVYVPLEGGEKPGTQLPVNVNGHRYNIPKGVSVVVPKTVAEIIAESQNIYMNNSASKLDLSNADASTQNALS